VPARRSTAAGIWGWIEPLRAQRRKRRRFASSCFLAAGVAFGSLIYLVLTRADRTFDPAHLPVFLALVGLMVATFCLGASAEGEIARLEEEIAELEEEAVRRLGERG
jgi:hypothetical protein